MASVNNVIFSSEEMEYLKQSGLLPYEMYRSALGTIPRDAPRKSAHPNAFRPLKGHQEQLLYAMIDFEKDSGPPSIDSDGSIRHKNKRMGILMERVGAGKTDVILNLFMHCPRLTRTDFFLTVNDRGRYYQQIKFVYNSKTLSGDLNWIVVPHTILQQWKDLISKFNIKCEIFTDKKHLDELDKKQTTNLWLVSSTRYRELVHLWNNLPTRTCLARLVFDECDSIYIPSCRPVEAAFYWFITSSAQNIFHPTPRYSYDPNTKKTNSVGITCTGFIRDTITEVTPFLENLILKCDYIYVKECLDLPDPYNKTLKVKSSVLGRALQGAVSSSVVSMINAGDLEGVASHYNIKTVSSELELVNKVIEKFEAEMKRAIDQPTQTEATRKKVQGLRDNIKIIKDRINSQDQCNICFTPKDPTDGDEDFIVKPTLTPCCHSIWCFECIINALTNKTKCPKCSKNINLSELISVGDFKRVEPIDPTEDTIFDQKSDAFMYIIKNMVDNNKVSKILCFSEYDNGFDYVIKVCESFNIKATHLKGTNVSIKNKIDAWRNSNKISVLLLNARRFGAGLNLQDGTDIVLWHKLSSKVKGETDLENQVLGRVIRYGVQSAPTVWRLSYPDEY